MGEVILKIEKLQAGHDRSSFQCGNAILDRYLREQASQDARRHISSVFVAIDGEGEVVGFFTLAMSSIETVELPGSVARKLPRYRMLPAILMGRMAVRGDRQGRGIGAKLVGAGMKIALALPIAWAFFVVDAKDAAASAFYRHFGFQSLADDPHHLFLARP